MSSEMKKAQPKMKKLKTALDFKQTVLAALETPPEPRTKKKAKNQSPPKKAG